MAEQNRNQNSSRSGRGGRSGSSEKRTPEVPLNEREYRGKDGQIHHHTNTYMDQHGEEGGERGRSQSRGGSSRNRKDR